MKQESSHWTPYDDDYGTCVETRATLLIYPKGISPAEISSRLGLKPTEEVTAGQELTSKSGRTRIAKNSFWALSSDNSVRSLDLRRHLDWIIARLKPRARALLQLQEFPDIRMAVNCAWYSRSGHGGPTLWPEQMQALADLNLECTFDIYFLPDDSVPSWLRGQ